MAPNLNCSLIASTTTRDWTSTIRNMGKIGQKQHDVLWTGGWDSTFRISYLALVEKVSIQPHYIIDVGRQSSLRELQAISEIRTELSLLDKQAEVRILPLKITSILDIPKDDHITEAYHRLRARAWLGGQYDWLARYAKSNELSGLELSVHIDDKAYLFLQEYVKLFDGDWALTDDETLLASNGNADLKIFSRFKFPLLEFTKVQMRDLAQKHGFLSALEKTWFCFCPLNGKPCETCNPCIYAVEEGMGYRFPKSSMMRYRLRHAKKFVSIPFKIIKKTIKLIRGY